MIFMLEQALAHPQGEPLATERSVDHWQALAATPGEGAAFLPPTRGTVYGTLLNHLDALAALGDQVHAAPYKAPPRAPILYIKPRNTVVGHRVPVISVPQFTWYYFPRNFAFVGALEHGVGALLAGLILAKLVKPANG